MTSQLFPRVLFCFLFFLTSILCPFHPSHFGCFYSFCSDSLRCLVGAFWGARRCVLQFNLFFSCLFAVFSVTVQFIAEKYLLGLVLSLGFRFESLFCLSPLLCVWTRYFTCLVCLLTISVILSVLFCSLSGRWFPRFSNRFRSGCGDVHGRLVCV